MPVGAYMAADTREQESETVQQLRRCAECAAHPSDARALVQGKRGRYVEDFVDVGATCLRYASARVGGKRLKIAARAFCIENAEGERRFARPRYSGNADKLIEGNVDIDVFQVVHPCAAYLDTVGHLTGRVGDGCACV